MPINQLIRIKMVAGDTLPELIGRVEDIAEWVSVDGVRRHPPLNLTGYTLKLIIRRPKGKPILIKTAAITDAANGLFIFSWEPTDMVGGQQQAAEIQMVDPNGRTTTFADIEFNVEGSIYADSLAEGTTP